VIKGDINLNKCSGGVNMATYHTIKCPHCKNVVEFSVGKPKHYGSPFRICKNCGHEYVDTNYVEAALLTKSSFLMSFSWLGFILRIFISLTLIVWTIDAYGFDFDLLAIAVIGVGIALLISPIKQLITLIRYALFKDEKFQRELEASKKRLSDPKYVIALWKAGAYITYDLLEWAKEAVMDANDNVEPVQTSEETPNIGIKL
jgi:phage FluMu protein Com